MSGTNLGEPQSLPCGGAGLRYALLANSLWGIMPLYFQIVAHLPSIEVAAHRIIWCSVLLWGMVAACGHTRQVVACLCRPGAVCALFATALLLVHLGRIDIP
jgi:chloramphenicol-sensitive protein RarD